MGLLTPIFSVVKRSLLRALTQGEDPKNPARALPAESPCNSTSFTPHVFCKNHGQGPRPPVFFHVPLEPLPSLISSAEDLRLYCSTLKNLQWFGCTRREAEFLGSYLLRSCSQLYGIGLSNLAGALLWKAHVVPPKAARSTGQILCGCKSTGRHRAYAAGDSALHTWQQTQEQSSCCDEGARKQVPPMFFISGRAFKNLLSYIPEIALPETCYAVFSRDLGGGSDSPQ